MIIHEYLNKIKVLPEPVRQIGGLVTITIFIILSFAILNIYWGGGDELIRKMKIEEERIEKERKVNEVISSLPSGIVVFYDGTDHYRLSKEQYQAVCNITKPVSYTHLTLPTTPYV